MTYKNNYGNEWAKDYIDVATRIAEFRAKYPNGSLQPANIDEPIKIFNIGDKTYLQYIAVAYRNENDTKPGIGIAWELFPGKTPFTRDSEAMVCETSAWGRAIVAALAADTKKGIATYEEVKAAKSRQDKNDDNDNIKSDIIDPKQIQRIQILRKDIPSLQDDDIYSQKLLTTYGVFSTKDLTKTQAIDLISKLQKAADIQ